MRYTLRQLEVFLAVARTESINKAAGELSLSQSATSAALQEFEGRYDIQLFDRVAKRLRLNRFGSAIRPKAEALMQQAAAFEREILHVEDRVTLRLAASLTIGNYLAVGHVLQFKERYPSTEVELHIASTPEVVDQVMNFECDIGLIEAEVRRDSLQLIPWCEDRMQVFCSPDHPFAKLEGLDNSHLLEAKWILREPESGARQTFDRAMHGLLPDLNIGFELTHNEAIKKAVRQGFGLGCLSRIALEDEFREGALIPLTVPGRDMSRTFYFALHRDAQLSETQQAWINLCTEKRV